jgi:hypothetical protein
VARSRNLKPGFFTNEILAECAPHARLLFAGLWTIADREGRLEDRPQKIKALIFPYERVNVESLLSSLTERKFLYRYVIGESRFIQVLNFNKHQTPHVKEPASIIPEPDLSESGLVSSQVLSELPHIEGIRNQESVIGNGESDRGRVGKFQPPTVDEVAAYCAERKNGIDAEAFVASYASKGWRVGRSPMRDWKSAVVTWEKNKGQFGTVQPVKNERVRISDESN